MGRTRADELQRSARHGRPSSSRGPPSPFMGADTHTHTHQQQLGDFLNHSRRRRCCLRMAYDMPSLANESGRPPVLRLRGARAQFGYLQDGKGSQKEFQAPGGLDDDCMTALPALETSGRHGSSMVPKARHCRRNEPLSSLQAMRLTGLCAPRVRQTFSLGRFGCSVMGGLDCDVDPSSHLRLAADLPKCPHAAAPPASAAQL